VGRGIDVLLPAVEIPEFLGDTDLGGVGVLLGALDEPACHGCHWLAGRAKEVTEMGASVTD
jgi:hypothetical protein